MLVTINRNLCGHPVQACERCFGEFLRLGAVPDRGCILDVVDDGRPEITAKIISGKYSGTLVVSDENRQQVMVEGYSKFVDLPPEAFDIVQPHGQDIRRILQEQESKK